MRFHLLAIVLVLTQVAAAQTAAPTKTPVLVELFTSEGCSSCPPADALLSRLVHNQPISSAEIIVLGEHVDYWDGLGWHDRFSSSQFTARQSQYGASFQLDSVYTPQMVVDGTAQFVGNDQTQVWRAVAAASRVSKVPLTLSGVTLNGRHISATVSTPGTVGPGDLFAALVDPVDTTDVRRGENSGEHLQHVGVVRVLSRIGTTRDLAEGPLHFTLTLPETAVPSTMQVVVFAQQTSGSSLGSVLGATIGNVATGIQPQRAGLR